MAPRGGRSSTHGHLHSMILFKGESDLRRQVAPYAEEAARRGKVFSVITPHEARDRKLIAGIMKRAGRRRPKLFVHDAKLLTRSPDPTASFAELWDRMEEEYELEPRGWTNVGCFPHEFYPRFEIMVEMERHLNRRRPPADILCCYSDEGFCSLEPREILDVFELHDTVRFPGAVFSAERRAHTSWA